MFDKIGQIMGLISNPGKIREEAEKLAARVGQIVAEGSAGGGMVTARVNGHGSVVALKISEEAMQDRELLEDLVAGAVNHAAEKARTQAAEETGRMATNLGLPPGFRLPGMG